MLDLQMGNDLEQVKVNWAWEPFDPSPAQPWDRRLAAHLYRRAAFGASHTQLDDAVKSGLEASVSALMDPGQGNSVEKFDAEAGRLGQAMMGSGKTEDLGAWWLYRMGKTPSPLVERMALFWHGHFATSAAKVDDANLMRRQDTLLHQHALGSFADLVQAMAKDPAMLVWLDSTSNRKARPNENFARELMELFCLGPGHYTEEDIRQMARCFTGWEVRQGEFFFNRFQHDAGSPSFLGRSGNFNGEDAVDLVLEQPAAAWFVVRKLARFLLAEEPALPDRLLAPLVTQLRQNSFEVAGVVRRILRSNLFYSEHAVGRRVRSPVDLAIGLLRCLEATTDYVRLNQALSRLGQGLYFPPNVKGWEGGRTWIHSAALLERTNLVGRIARGKETRFAGGSLAEAAAVAGATSVAETADWLLELLVAVPVGPAGRQAIVRAVDDGSPEELAARTLHAISWLPEFQLS